MLLNLKIVLLMLSLMSPRSLLLYEIKKNNKFIVDLIFFFQVSKTVVNCQPFSTKCAEDVVEIGISLGEAIGNSFFFSLFFLK